MERADGFQLVAMPHILFGTGAIEQVGEWCAQLGSRALVVTGRGSLRRSGWLDEIVSVRDGWMRLSAISVTTASQLRCSRALSLSRR